MSFPMCHHAALANAPCGISIGLFINSENSPREECVWTIGSIVEPERAMSQNNVLILASNQLLREGLKLGLKRSEFIVTGEGRDIDEARKQGDSAKIPDIVIAVGTSSGNFDAVLEEVRKARIAFPETKCAIVADQFSSAEVLRALQAGVGAVLSMDASFSMILSSLKLVVMGQQIFPTLPAAMLAPQSEPPVDSVRPLPSRRRRCSLRPARPRGVQFGAIQSASWHLAGRRGSVEPSPPCRIGRRSGWPPGAVRPGRADPLLSGERPSEQGHRSGTRDRGDHGESSRQERASEGASLEPHPGGDLGGEPSLRAVGTGPPSGPGERCAGKITCGMKRVASPCSAPRTGLAFAELLDRSRVDGLEPPQIDLRRIALDEDLPRGCPETVGQ